MTDTRIRDVADALKDGRPWMIVQRPSDRDPISDLHTQAVSLAMAELRAKAANYEKALRYVQEFLEQTYSPDEHNDSPGNMAYATVLHALEGGDVG